MSFCRLVTRPESKKQAETRSQKVSNILPKSIFLQTRLWEDHDRCKRQRHDYISISEQAHWQQNGAAHKGDQNVGTQRQR